MKDKLHVAELGVTAACTVRLLEDAQSGDDQIALLQADAWFGSVAVGKQGHQAVLQVKTGHALYPKKFINDTLKDAPGGVWIALESILEGIPLIAMDTDTAQDLPYSTLQPRMQDLQKKAHHMK